jgi:hypothetical protein
MSTYKAIAALAAAPVAVALGAGVAHADDPVPPPPGTDNVQADQDWWNRYVPCGVSFGVSPISPNTPMMRLRVC